MSLTIKDFTAPTQHPYEMLQGHSHASEKESLLVWILAECIEAGDLYAAITTKYTHPDMVSSRLLDNVGERQYRLTKKAAGLLYGYYASDETEAHDTLRDTAPDLYAALEFEHRCRGFTNYCNEVYSSNPNEYEELVWTKADELFPEITIRFPLPTPEQALEWCGNPKETLWEVREAMYHDAFDEALGDMATSLCDAALAKARGEASK